LKQFVAFIVSTTMNLSEVR